MKKRFLSLTVSHGHTATWLWTKGPPLAKV
jgi:hypothetical protein